VHVISYSTATIEDISCFFLSPVVRSNATQDSFTTSATTSALMVGITNTDSVEQSKTASSSTRTNEQSGAMTIIPTTTLNRQSSSSAAISNTLDIIVQDSISSLSAMISVTSTISSPTFITVGQSSNSDVASTTLDPPSSGSGGGSSSSSTVIIVGGIIGAAVCIAIIIVTILVYYLRRMEIITCCQQAKHTSIVGKKQNIYIYDTVQYYSTLRIIRIRTGQMYHPKFHSQYC